MCAIIDAANVGSELWNDSGNEAGQAFRKAVDDGRVPLVSGGSKLNDELAGGSLRLRNWFAELRRSGKLTICDGASVDAREKALAARSSGTAPVCKSNDHHVIALAQESGARLLYTNDRALQDDFGNSYLINAPRGKVYSTGVTSDFSRPRRRLLNQPNLCKPRNV